MGGLEALDGRPPIQEGWVGLEPALFQAQRRGSLLFLSWSSALCLTSYQAQRPWTDCCCQRHSRARPRLRPKVLPIPPPLPGVYPSPSSAAAQNELGANCYWEANSARKSKFPWMKYLTKYTMTRPMKSRIPLTYRRAIITVKLPKLKRSLKGQKS